MSTLSTIITPGNVLTATNTQTVTNKDLSSGTNTFPAFGDVDGPASTTDNAIARFDGTTGKLIQNSAVTIDDTTGSMTFTGSSARIKGTFDGSSTGTLFQTTGTNLPTELAVIPSGTSTVGGRLTIYKTTDVTTNTSQIAFFNNGSEGGINTNAAGTGTVVPIKFTISGVPALTVRTDKGVDFAGAIDETVYAVSGTTPALSPSNGTIQTWTLSASSTPTAGTWNEGESMTIMIADGTAYTVTWTSVAVTWVGGTAPTLATTGYTVIELWKVGSTIYGADVGDVA